MRDTVKQWLEQSEYDFETAKAMLKTSRFLYVAFMCQQSIEKHLKAIICRKTEEMPPYIHNLTTLAEHLGLSLDNEQLDFLDLLSRYYLNTRYPVVKQALSKNLNDKNSLNILNKTESFLKWLAKK
ncbi:HEPN domain-containing protein [bacterium]|nr:HEPN domain-containing protein [bacterium]